MAIKEYSAFPKVLVLLEPHHHQCHIQNTRRGNLTLLQRYNRCILQPQPTGPYTTWGTSKSFKSNSPASIYTMFMIVNNVHIALSISVRITSPMKYQENQERKCCSFFPIIFNLYVPRYLIWLGYQLKFEEWCIFRCKNWSVGNWASLLKLSNETIESE